MFGQQNRLGTHLMRMSGKGKSEDNEKSMVLMSLLWKRGTRMEFSGHAHGQTQSLGHWGHSRKSGEGKRQNGDRETPAGHTGSLPAGRPWESGSNSL